jgi:hypothetical protein
MTTFYCYIFLIISLININISFGSTSYDDNLKEKALNGDCSFYNDLEKIKGCGNNGYLLKYGGYYCQKFGDNEDKFNEEGQTWINGVRKCLMGKLIESSSSLSCKGVSDYAFDTHVQCYLNPGYGSKSICDLWLSKNFIGLWNVYEINTFFSNFSAVKQVVATMFECAKHYSSNIVKQLLSG